MKFLLYIAFLTMALSSWGQLSGTVMDTKGGTIPGVRIKNMNADILCDADLDGKFKLKGNIGDTLRFSMHGFDTTYIAFDKSNKTITLMSVQDIGEVNVIRKRLADFDVGYLPPIKGVQIYTGTGQIIKLDRLNGAKSAANPREMFAKIPGLNIWESDGAGIQIGIGGRGLSPNRTANFNTRQNGHDISADALGYPESYYTPPFEALESVEIIRGSAALQFGTQFGGLLNFIIKEPPTTTPFEFTTRNTVGTYGYFGTFNRIAGSKNRFFYQVYHQYKRGDGYRENSEFNQHQLFGQIGYHITERTKVRLEYTHMNYLARQAGGLSDLQFEQNPRQSLRDRNWFNVNWNTLAFHFDHEFSDQAYLNVRAFGMHSSRKTLGFLGKITQQDPGGAREMLSGDFQNAGVEARFLRRYIPNQGKDIRGAVLLGGRYYQGQTIANQGIATDGNDADFTYQNPNDLEGSSFTYPSQNASLFAENILFIGKKLTLNAGVRLEHINSGSGGYYKQYLIHPVNNDTLNIYTRTDSNVVSRQVPLFGGGLSYKVSKRAKLYTNFTQNYRAINFTDIRVNNPNVVVDSTMRDEYGYTAELGFRGMKKDYWIYDIAGFYVFYGDKIGLAPKPGTVLKERTNIGDARNFGVEIFSEFDFVKALTDSSNHSLSLFVNAAYINAKYIRSKEPNFVDKQVEYVSPVILKSGLRYRYKTWSFQVQGSYNAAQFADASNSVVPSGDAVIGEVPAYYVFDMSGRYTFPKYFQVEFGVNNFTNQSYFTRRATGYPGPGILPSDGITAYVTVQFKISK
ncbi:MAG: TonB-dependent receptor [bacterium]|nr:TonB-dependent receptor [bacterium]